MRFVLVHGGFHGAWCWDLLIPQLEARGHQAVAVELPGHGERVDETASLAGYRDAVVDHIQSGDVIVGHSMGGFVATVAAAAALDRVSHIVYLAAGLPSEGRTMSDGGAGRTTGRASSIEMIDNDTRMRFRDEQDAIDFFYHDCDPALARWACDKLTPEPLAPLREPISIPAFWEAQLPRSLILCREDRATGAGDEGSRRTAARLGVEPLWLESSHSPFLSQPSLCAEALIASIGRPGLGPIRST